VLDQGPIDTQHQRLVEMVEQFDHFTREMTESAALEELFAGLVEYAAVHFEAEERAMRKAGYPDLALHEEEHARFVRTVRQLKQFKESGRPGVRWGVVVFLKRWLVGHILGSDRQFWTYVDSTPEGRALRASGELYR